MRLNKTGNRFAIASAFCFLTGLFIPGGSILGIPFGQPHQEDTLKMPARLNADEITVEAGKELARIHVKKKDGSVLPAGDYEAPFPDGGQIIFRVSEKGLLTGKAILIFDEQSRAIFNMVDGLAQGEGLFYQEGRLRSKAEFDQGETLSLTQFDEHGRKVKVERPNSGSEMRTVIEYGDEGQRVETDYYKAEGKIVRRNYNADGQLKRKETREARKGAGDLVHIWEYGKDGELLSEEQFAEELMSNAVPAEQAMDAEAVDAAVDAAAEAAGAEYITEEAVDLSDRVSEATAAEAGFKQKGAGLQELIPVGWKLLAESYGDLNRDGAEDLVFVVQGTDPGLVKRNEGGPGIDSADLNPRLLAVYFKDKGTGSYRKELIAQDFIVVRSSPTMDEPLKEVSVTENGDLKFGFHFFYSAGSWFTSSLEYVFRYRQGEFVLIRYASEEVRRNTGEFQSTQADFTTGAVHTLTENISGEEPAHETWDTLTDPPVLTFETAGVPLDLGALEAVAPAK